MFFVKRGEMLEDGLTVSWDRVNILFSLSFIAERNIQFSFEMFSLRHEEDGCTDVGEEISTKLRTYES